MNALGQTPLTTYKPIVISVQQLCDLIGPWLIWSSSRAFVSPRKKT